MTTTNSSPTNGTPKPSRDDLDRLEEIVGNAMLMRAELFKKFLDPRRNIDDECGYPTTGQMTADAYQDLYDREPIATRIVQLMPKESWQVTPLVYEDEDSGEPTEFEDAWDELGQQLRGDNSYYQDEEGSPIWEYLLRADILSGIGSFGLILLGINDGKQLDQPAEGVENNGNGKGSKFKSTKGKLSKDGNPTDISGVSKDVYGGAAARQQGYSNLGTDAQYLPIQFSPAMSGDSGKGKKDKPRLLFLRVFPEHLVQVVQYEADTSNPRFGQPVMYNITLNDPRTQHTGIGLPLSTVRVHWTRVIHIADNLSSSEIFGVPRIQPVLNPVLDIRKIRGASAEGYWKTCFTGLALSTHPQLGGEVRVDRDQIRDMMENYQNSLQKYITLMGMSANTLAPSVVDPTPHIEVSLVAICIQLGCPIRVFKGSERGELASSQDDAAWNDRLRQRQIGYNTPKIIVPFIDRLIALGILPEPKGSKESSDEAVDTSTLSVKDGMTPKPPTGNRSRTRIIRNHRTKTIYVYNADTNKMEPKEIDASTSIKIETRGGYSVEWPDLDSLTDKDKATIFLTRAQAYSAAIAGNVESIFTPIDMMTKLDGMDEEEAQAILDEAAKLVEEKQQEAQDLADEHGMIPEAPPGFQHPEPEPPPMAGMPGGPPQPGVKLNPGQSLVHPQTGSTIAKTKPIVAKTKSTTANEEVDNSNPEGHNQYTGGSSRKLERGEKIKFKLHAEMDLPSTGTVVAHYEKEGTVRIKTRDRREHVIRVDQIVDNVFCATGPGGGIDSSCSPGETSVSKGKESSNEPITKESTTAPPPGKSYTPNVEADSNGDGVTDAARIGVPAMSVPPPPNIAPLPNLTEHERMVERDFIEHYQSNPDKVASDFRRVVADTTKPGDPPTFGTDDAKVLSVDWNHPDLAIQSENRATLNCALHQTANAIAKRAFLQHLDTLSPGDQVMVTVGGCGAGKGYALSKTPEALELKSRSKAVWDSAGDQNATENPWVQREAESRGLRVAYMHVHADPESQWANPKMGVVARAAKPEDGRMVDAQVFADSYALGARNHQAFYESNKDNPHASFMFLSNPPTGKLSGIPKEALSLDRHALARFAQDAVRSSNAPSHVIRGATIGQRIWGHEDQSWGE